jgi:hypothetical protein
MFAGAAATHPPIDIEKVMSMDDRATQLGMVNVRTKCGVRLENDILSIGNVTTCYIGQGANRVAGEVTRWYRQTLHSYMYFGLAQPFRHTLDTSKNDMFELAAYTAHTSPQYYEMLKWCVQLAMLKRRDELGIPIPHEAGVHDESQLNWSGHIPLPEGEVIELPPPKLEPLAGVPEPQVDPAPQITVAPGSEILGSGRQQQNEMLSLPAPEGARQPAVQSVVVPEPALLTSPQTPLLVDSGPRQSEVQQKTSPTVADSDKTVVTHGKTITSGPVVPTNEKVKPPSSQPLSRDGGSVHCVVEKRVKLTARQLALKEKQKPLSSSNNSSKLVTLQKPQHVHQPKHVQHVQKVKASPIVPPKTPVVVNKPTTSQPIVRIVHALVTTSAPSQIPRPAHMRGASAPPQPSASGASATVTKKVVFAPLAYAPHPVKPAYNLRPRYVSHVSRPAVPQSQPHVSKQTVGASSKPIVRSGVGYLSENSAIPLQVGYTVVEPTAFTASAPYDMPDSVAYEIDGPDREYMVCELMRHFGVEDKLDGPIHVDTDAIQLPLPQTLKQAMVSPYAKDWVEATVEEWLSLVSSNTWSLVEREPWMKVIPCKWIFTRFKARLVTRGHIQIEGVDYNETYAPVSKHATLRTLFSVAANRNWYVHQLDIKTTFLHGYVDVDVYMLQHVGLMVSTMLW